MPAHRKLIEGEAKLKRVIAAYKETRSLVEVARMYGVSVYTIKAIIMEREPKLLTAKEKLYDW